MQAEIPEGMLGVTPGEVGTGMFALSTTLLVDCRVYVFAALNAEA